MYVGVPMARPLVVRSLSTRFTHRPRDPEVGHHGVPALEQDVPRLDVAVHHPARVGVGQRVGHLAGERQGIGDRKRPSRSQSLAQRLALDVGHDVVEQAVGLAGIVQRKDVRVGEPGGDLDLAEEPLGAERPGELGAEDLYGNRAMMAGIGCKVDGGHAPAPDLTFERVASGEDSAGANQNALHALLSWA